MPNYKFKLLIFGDGGVGKTTLVNRYLTGIFTGGSLTIGVDFHLKVVTIEGIEITLQIWDFAGEERFRFLLPSYVVGSDGVIFMFDLTRYSSIKNISEWLSVFKESYNTKEKKIPVIMVGSKLDLDLKRSVSKEDAKNVAEEYNFNGYIECSSKTGENVEEIFVEIGQLMMKNLGLIE